MQIDIFMNGNTMLTGVMSHIIVQDVQISDPRYPI